ncbi:MAG: anhydro-N-acetylmuramic acid kinase, partial [Proteobacteria bacterium]|nr:anhydro-N-acetylmuramic acid kinase [Pseudomonadota bacterium]
MQGNNLAAGSPVTPTDDGPLFLGIMSGTSLDALDAVLIRVAESGPSRLGFWSRPMPEGLQEAFIQLHNPLCEAALLKAQQAALAFAYEVSQLVHDVRKDIKGLGPIRAVGVHGQTILHRPELG